jgi:DNA-binding HxlR family transcriptional regulator
LCFFVTSRYNLYSDYEIPHVGSRFSRAMKPSESKKDIPAAIVQPELCTSFHTAIELIGRRWTGAIIFLLLKGRCRFATLRDAIPDITDRMLSERLQELDEHGVVVRTVFPETPVRIEYALTAKGRALADAVDAIAEWAHTWGPPNTDDPVHKPARTKKR